MPKKQMSNTTKRAGHTKRKKSGKKPTSLHSYPSPMISDTQSTVPTTSPAAVATAAKKTRERLVQKRPVVDYSYVLRDLKRIGVLTTIIIALMILSAFLLR